MKRFILLMFVIFFNVLPIWGREANQAIEVFPSLPFYQYIIYINLTIFWIAILGLIIIIRMKLKEIERVQKMGLDKREGEAPPICKQEANSSV